MTQHPDAKIYLVDDDVGVREALAWLLRTRRLLSEGYDSAGGFLWTRLRLVARGAKRAVLCVAGTWRMSGMSGLALFERFLALPWQACAPVIFLSGPCRCAHGGGRGQARCFRFLREAVFRQRAGGPGVEQALNQSAQVLALRRAQTELQQRLESLTDRERDVMDLVVAGLPNKLVADQLNISVRTVEVHRSRVFDKMGVKSAVELANVLRPS